MKRKKAVLYNPYLDTLGGGEKHILSILKVLEEEGYEINIFWDKDLTNEIKTNFKLEFKHKINFLHNIFRSKKIFFQKYLTLKNFDLFFYVTDGSYFFSGAKKNFVFCMVPNKKLYQLDFLAKIKTSNYKFITNSEFTKYWLEKHGQKSQTIYPFIDKNLLNLNINILKKDKVILTVGRFFKHLHSKRHDILINSFKELKQNNSLFKDFKLILAGGLKTEDNQYLEWLKQLASSDRSIVFRVNPNYEEILELYKKAVLYWHFTGFGIDENENPELVEHLGIAPLEAMAAGCITFCYNAGGPKEIIEDGVNGFLFNNNGELFKNATLVLQNSSLRNTIQTKAKQTVVTRFSYEVFKRNVKKIVLNQ